MSRYIIDCTTRKETHPEVAAFLRKVNESLEKKIEAGIESGRLTSLGMFRKLGEEKFSVTSGRIVIPTHIVDTIREKIAVRKLSITSSEWGDHEKQEHQDGTKPGLEDFYPASMGYNNTGGPHYNFTVSEKEIVLSIHICYMKDNGWDEMPSMDSEYRIFRIGINDDAEDELNAVFDLFLDTIREKYVAHVKSTVLDSIAEQLAETAIADKVK